MPEPITLLLVEDEYDLAMVIVRELQSIGFQTVHVSDGERALDMIGQIDPSMVILDWMLPKLDGLSVLRRLREQSIVPVLMLTARDAEIDRVLGLELGADDYLTKPFSMRELVARIRAMLRRRELIQQTMLADREIGHKDKDNILETHGICLVPDEYAVTVDGALIKFTRTEFAIFHLLLRNPGRVFSRTYLLDTVWGEDFIKGDRSVDNTVLRMRKKLGSTGDMLESIYGVGYRWHKDSGTKTNDK